MAIGAGSSAIRYLVVREAIMAAAAGTVLGLTESVWLSRALERLLYGRRRSIAPQCDRRFDSSGPGRRNPGCGQRACQQEGGNLEIRDRVERAHAAQ